MIKAIRNRIVAGLFIIIPLGVTFWLAYFIYAKMTAWAVELAHSVTNIHNFWFVQTIRIISLLFMLLVLFVIGQLGSYKVGQILISVAEWFVERLPLINTIYSTIRQIGEALWSPQGGMFRQVVLFEYPRKGLWVIGFLTNENKKAFEINDKTDEELISVFLPTTPNPTSGFLLFVPRRDCKFLKMSVAEGMRLVISGGAVSTPDIPVSPEQNGVLQEPSNED
jgi:uncharacterized membrane protein